MQNHPLISVIIPTYNCAQHIHKAISSAARQSLKGFEIIVVDDGSTDATRQVVNGLNDASIRYIYQSNQGVAQARNTGVLAAKGDFIAYVDADDELDEQMFELCYDSIVKDNSEWCVTDILKIRISDGIREEIAEKSPVPSSSYVYHILQDDFVLRAPFFRRKTLLDIGLYDARLLTREDWDMSIRLIRENSKFSYIGKPLYKYYYRNNSLMRKSKLLSYNCTLKVLQKHHRRMADNGDHKARQIYADSIWGLGRNYLVIEQDIKHFIYCVVESMRYDFDPKRLVRGLRRILSNLSTFELI